jgi:starvation-inducible DNA-binding protein
MSAKPVNDTKINLTPTARQSVTDLLNVTLGSLIDLHWQTKQAHWTVRGPQFWQLHKMFDELAAAVDEPIDSVAERITALGGFPRGTICMSAAASQLAEFPEKFDEFGHVTALIERFGALGNSVREQIDKTDELGDKDSADLLTGISRMLDLQLWFLEAHTRREA